jgi:hypothetical protein
MIRDAVIGAPIAAILMVRHKKGVPELDGGSYNSGQPSSSSKASLGKIFDRVNAAIYCLGFWL